MCLLHRLGRLDSLLNEIQEINWTDIICEVSRMTFKVQGSRKLKKWEVDSLLCVLPDVFFSSAKMKGCTNFGGVPLYVHL